MLILDHGEELSRVEVLILQASADKILVFCFCLFHSEHLLVGC